MAGLTTVNNWWNEWSMQFLVLLSLALQVLLLSLAGVRRHTDEGIWISILWAAYQLADYTTTYALGNLGASSARHEHQLVAFWAPFLLLHFGGPDNIAAYELEDNKLWGRSILNLVASALGAGYVLYRHISGDGWTSFSVAAIFMGVIGLVKSLEKTWALKNASLSDIRDSVRAETPDKKSSFFLDYEEPRLWRFKQGGDVAQQEELLKRHAHALFYVCKSAMVDSSVGDEADDPTRSSTHQPDRLLTGFSKKDLLQEGSKDHQGMTRYKWKLIEMELSFMYDILYTKAAVVYKSSGLGYIIRAASSLVVATSLLIFLFSGKAGLSIADVAITYVLLAGALVLETISLLAAVLSSWTFAFLSTTPWSWIRHALLCSGRWNQLRRVAVSLHRLDSGCVRVSREWHGTMGQCSMLDRSSRRGKAEPLAGRWAKACSWLLPSSSAWTVSVPDMVRECVEDHIKYIKKNSDMNTLGVIRKNWGKVALSRHEDFHVDDGYLGAEVQEGIVMWHIATDILLTVLGKLTTTTNNTVEADDVAEAIKAISQYMMFLLLERPDMLPGLAQIKLYQRTENTLAVEWDAVGNIDKSDAAPAALSPAIVSWFIRRIYTKVMELYGRGPNSDSRLLRREKLADRLLDEENSLDSDKSGVKARVRFGVALAKQLIERQKEKKDSLQIVLDMWTDILVYTANRCSRESHAKQLGKGGEFTTLVWLMAEHYHQAN